MVDKLSNGNGNSIHETLQAQFLASNYSVLIHDHGTGEISDFISINELTDCIAITLYHVKGSRAENPGNRVGDVYEVCMQVLKSQSLKTGTTVAIKCMKN